MLCRLPNIAARAAADIRQRLALPQRSFWGTRNGANNGTRTRDIQDHNLALYQLSYVRHPGGRV